ncbi:hypothetical protein D3C85_1109900 [compost metagenome]
MFADALLQLIFYGKIPTSILMDITADITEKMFLSYIGETTYDNAYQMVEYLVNLNPKLKVQIKGLNYYINMQLN